MRNLIAVAVVLLALARSLAGCPRLPPPEGCTPHSSRCSPRGVPQICSSTQRWTNVAEDTCASVGVVCCEARDTEDAGTVHACAPPSWCLATDGGAR